ncbi:MAG: hypothetical protein KAY37_11875 [Phycisphaerae bacterium]|nr:hypothetical protein [Phycisphaerae bacterium]
MSGTFNRGRLVVAAAVVSTIASPSGQGAIFIDEPSLIAARVANLPSPCSVGIGFDDDVFVVVRDGAPTSTGVVRVDKATWAVGTFTTYAFTGNEHQIAFDAGAVFGSPRLIISDTLSGCEPSQADSQRHFDANGAHMSSFSNGLCSTSIAAVGAGPVWGPLVLWGDAYPSGAIKGRDASGTTAFSASVPPGCLNGSWDVGVLVPSSSTFASNGRTTLVFTDEWADPQVGLSRVSDLGVYSSVGGPIGAVGVTDRGIAYETSLDTILVIAQATDGGYARRLLRVRADGTYTVVAHTESDSFKGLAVHPDGTIYVTLMVEQALYAIGFWAQPEYNAGDQSDVSGTSDDPVNTATGSFFHQETDLSIPSRGSPLTFTRFYNSKAAAPRRKAGKSKQAPPKRKAPTPQPTSTTNGERSSIAAKKHGESPAGKDQEQAANKSQEKPKTKETSK